MIAWVAGLLVLVLIQSSWLNWPLLLCGSYLLVNRFGVDRSLLTIVLLGILLDILTLRAVGESSLLLLVFLLGMHFWQNSLGRGVGRGWWLLVMAVVWQGVMVGWGIGGLFLAVILAGGSVLFGSRWVSSFEIKLRA